MNIFFSCRNLEQFSPLLWSGRFSEVPFSLRENGHKFHAFSEYPRENCFRGPQLPYRSIAAEKLQCLQFGQIESRLAARRRQPAPENDIFLNLEEVDHNRIIRGVYRNVATKDNGQWKKRPPEQV
jgi:hypothetical protein